MAPLCQLKRRLHRLPYGTQFCTEISHYFYCEWNQGSKACIPPTGYAHISVILLSIFLSYSGLFLPTHCRCRGLVLHLNTLNVTHTHTLSGTPWDEGSECRSDLNLTINNSHKAQTPLPPAGLEPTIPASNQPKTHALDCIASGILHTSLITQL